MRDLGNDPGLLLDLSVRLVELVLEFDRLFGLFFEYEATQAGGTLLWCQFIEEPIEQELTKHEFITCTNLAGNTSLELHNIGIINKSQTSKDALSALQLIELNDR